MVFTEALNQCQMEMWMFQGADDGKSGRMRGRRLTRRFWEMEICWRQWPGMGGIHSSGLRPMTSGKWKVRRTGNSFSDNCSANDPAVSGQSKTGRAAVFDIPAMEDAKWYTEQNFATGETITILTNSAGEKCALKSWVAADENILVVEFESETDLDVEFDFYFPDEIGKGCEKAVDVWGSGELENIQNGMFAGLVTGRPLQVKKTGGGTKWIQAVFRSCGYSN